jgi:DNA-binding FadR family transcriptional regulator
VLIDHRGDRDRYRQLADLIGEDIRSGKLKPGVILPSQFLLGIQYDLGIDTVRRALGVLRAQGLVHTVRGEGTRVRSSPQDMVVPLDCDDRVRARLATEQDLHGWGFTRGVPVLEIHRANGNREVHPGDRTELRVQVGT